MNGIITSTMVSRRSRRILLAAAACVLATPLPAVAKRAPAPVPVVAEPTLGDLADAELRPFYRTNQGQPLWFTEAGYASPAAYALVQLLETAEVDGATGLPAADAAAALDRVRTAPTAANRREAELLLSRLFVDYVKQTRTNRAPMLYEHTVMEPVVPRAIDALWSAAKAPSLSEYVRTMGWMHPLYAPLREALVAGRYGDDTAKQAIVATLARLRSIPAMPAKRYVLVDTAGARLWMYEDGKPVDSMKVVVGKSDTQTPTMAGYIRYAISNPYWNVPIELVRAKTAPTVLSQGMTYLKSRGYEVLSGWGDDATVIDPKTVDWRAVARGEADVRVRQRPNSGNAMGKVKYEFPNQLGIYLHDTPEKELMLKDARQFSNGCIRLEDAERLGRWLMGQPLPVGETPEQRVDLPAPVPIYVTHLTALPAEGHIAFVRDPYDRDNKVSPLSSSPQMATGGPATVAAR